MDQQNPFLRHALADNTAEQIVSHIAELDRNELLLWKAYLKRIKPVPVSVLFFATEAYRNGSETVGLRIQDGDDSALVMDKVGDLLWDDLDEAAQREWLLKAV